MSKSVYFDNASTTAVDKEVLEVMLPYFCDVFGNANSQHLLGREAMKAVDNARDTIAGIINCKPNEVYFTSGGTESDNWALKGISVANKDKGRHIIISSIEHPAMLESAKILSKNGFDVDYINVNDKGVIDISHLKSLIRKDTILIACMMANNEVGTIQPIKELAKIAHENGIYFFTDAVQTAGVLKLDVKELDVDLLSISSHKLYGPKGVGALYVKNGVRIESLSSGGHQERTKRGGTTNVAGVVGFAHAFKLAERKREESFNYVLGLRNYFIKQLQDKIPEVQINGDLERRLPANVDIYIQGVSGESLLFNLDLKGVCASLGSACSSGSVEPSHVLLAMGLGKERASNSVRFTLGKNNTKEEVDFVVECLTQIVYRLGVGKVAFKLQENTKTI